MKADITRNTFHAVKHFANVLMQQGRVQLDADFNEQAAIHHHYLRRLAADLIGPCGGPKENLGFALGALEKAGAPQTADFAFRWGHYYVDGVLCEVESTPVSVVSFPKANNRIVVSAWTVDGIAFAKGQYIQLYDADPAVKRELALLRITDVDYPSKTLIVNASVGAFIERAPKLPYVRRITTYLTQPDYAPAPPAAGYYHVYLDVWERLISYVEDDCVREVALGGPDTAARGKTVWQVKLLKADAKDVCLTPQGLSDLFQPANLALLKARARPVQTSDDPCTIAPDALYRGPENQCYRVEIHHGNIDDQGKPLTGKPSFKWSRENGAVVFPIRSGGGTNALVLETLGRDDRFGLDAGDFVEVQDDDSVLAAKAGNLLQVQSIDTQRLTVTLSGTPDASVGADPAKHPVLRRWDHKQGEAAEAGTDLGADNAAVIPAGDPGQGTWLTLEDGVQVQFSDPGKTVYRTGDYWLIPARVETGNVEWPSETITLGQGKVVTEPLALLPNGIVHRYAPLALLTVNPDNTTTHTSCQSVFTALAQKVETAVKQMTDTVKSASEMATAVKAEQATMTLAKSDQATMTLIKNDEAVMTNVRQSSSASSGTAETGATATPETGKP